MAVCNNAMYSQFRCCSAFAAAGTFARIRMILDTALPAVSILVVRLVRTY